MSEMQDTQSSFARSDLRSLSLSGSGKLPDLAVGLGPASNKVATAFEAFFSDPEKLWSVETGARVVIGVSGGLDSIVLAHALLSFHPAQISDFAFAHFDHALRVDSSQDTEFVRLLSEHWKVPFFGERGTVVNLGKGLEAAARDARYDFLLGAARQFRRQHRTPVLAVAHHLDDLAETLLLNMARGSGLDGIVGMHGHHYFKGVLTIRPLLRLRRSDLEAYAEENHLSWREDSTNDDQTIRRNFVRHEIMPRLRQLNPEVEEAFGRLSRVAEREQQRIRHHVNPMGWYAREYVHDQRVILPLARLKFYSHYFSEGIARIRTAFQQVFPDREQPGLDHLEALARQVAGITHVTGPHHFKSGINWSVIHYAPEELQPGLALVLHADGLPPWEPEGPWIRPEVVPILPSQLRIPGKYTLPSGWTLSVQYKRAPDIATVKENPKVCWLDAAKVRELRLAVPTAGMRLAPLGMGGHTRAVGDIFTDRKTLLSLRSQWPIIIDAHSGEVLWISWIATSDTGKLDLNSTDAWLLKWKPPARNHASRSENE